MSSPHPLRWFPPFAVGFVSVVAAEISAGLLLFSGLDFLRALTLVLAVLAGALAAGLWSAPPLDTERSSEALRRRWLLALLAYSGAAATAGAWELMGGLASAAMSRGLGLAFLAGLPLYASGTVLGALRTPRGERGSGERGSGVAVPAAVGATVGVAFNGFVLVPTLVPVSMFGLCLVILSGAALVHGRVLDRSPEEHVVDEEPSPFGVVRVVDRQWGSPRRHQRRLAVGARIIGGTEDGGPLRPWEKAASELLSAGNGAGPPVLLLGGSPVGLIDDLVEAGIPMEVVERNAVVRRMVVRHFGIPRTAEGIRVVDGLSASESTPGATEYRAIVVDGAALAGGDPMPLLNPAELARLRSLTAADGILLMGGDDPEPLLGADAWTTVDRLLRSAGWGSWAVYGTERERSIGRGLLAARRDKDGLPSTVGGMARVGRLEPLKRSEGGEEEVS